jgi:hypothetical protein
MLILYFTSPAVIFEASGPSGKMTQSIYTLERKSEPHLPTNVNLQLADSPTRIAEAVIHDTALNLKWRCLLTSRVTSWTGGGEEVECVIFAAHGLPEHTGNHSALNFNLMWANVSKEISAALRKAADHVNTNVKFNIPPGGDHPA